MSNAEPKPSWPRFLKLALIVWVLGSILAILNLFLMTVLRGEAVFNPTSEWSSLLIALPLAVIGVMSYSWLPALVITGFLWWRLAPDHQLPLTGNRRRQ
ncbi:MAG: hypothetical protein IT445_18850 [Phycisphaeraceae bacterium]|nr:hypothetical protein [Phycisphaeraceae bacterium]